MHDGGRPSGAESVLIEEACRTADRLDKLDAFLLGHDDSWLRFHARNGYDSTVEVVVDKALSEARQQQLALKQLLAELRQRGAASTGRSSSTGARGPSSVSDDLRSRVASAWGPQAAG